MVERQRQVDHGPDRDGVVADHRALLDGAHAENRYLRLIDDRGSQQAAEDARVGDGERTALHVVHAQPLGAGALGEIVHGARDAQEILLIRALDDRNDQPGLERDGDPHIDFPLVDDV